MKSILVHKFGGPDVMSLGEISAPEVGPDEVLIEVVAAGVNPVDMTFRSGMHPRSKGLKLPWIPGWDASGTVVSVGENVRQFQVGDGVCGIAKSGSYAQQCVLDVNRTMLLPQGFSFSEAASIPIATYTAYEAVVTKGRLQAGETVLIQGGAGGVGSMAIQIAKALGVDVITTVSSSKKASFCQQLGADHVINYKEQDLVERCLECTSGRGVDVVIETVASENFEKDCLALKQGGRLVLIGTGTGKSSKGVVDFHKVYANNIEIQGMSLFNVGSSFPQLVAHVQQLLNQKKIRPSICKTFSILEASQAHEFLLSSDVCGKVVLAIDSQFA